MINKIINRIINRSNYNKIEKYILEYLASQKEYVSEQEIIDKILTHFPTVKEHMVYSTIKTLFSESFIIIFNNNKSKFRQIAISADGHMRLLEIIDTSHPPLR